jgi:hypothetical protein
MEILLNVLIGIGLAATCGFRIFVPLLIMGIAGVSGYLNLSPGFEWIASTPAMIVFSIAAVVEAAAYFIPYIDNLLTAVSTPVSVVAGIMVTAAVMTDISPLLQWALAIIAGGGAASAASVISNGTHHASTVASGGITNPFISAIESVLSVIMPVLAIAVPVLAVILIALMMIGIYKLWLKLKKNILPSAASAKR